MSARRASSVGFCARITVAIGHTTPTKTTPAQRAATSSSVMSLSTVDPGPRRPESSSPARQMLAGLPSSSRGSSAFAQVPPLVSDFDRPAMQSGTHAAPTTGYCSIGTDTAVHVTLGPAQSVLGRSGRPRVRMRGSGTCPEGPGESIGWPTPGASADSRSPSGSDRDRRRVVDRKAHTVIGGCRAMSPHWTVDCRDPGPWWST